MFGNLLKATVGVVLLPVSAAKDFVTLGGELTNGKSAIKKSCKNISDNVDKALNPDED